jgi:hypothetical protein
MWTLEKALDRDEKILSDERRTVSQIENGQIKIGERTAEYLSRRKRIITELEALLQEHGRKI